MTCLSAALPAACIAVFRLPLSPYSILAIAGIFAALWLSQYTARWTGLSPEKLWDAGIFAVIAAFVLSRALGFALLLLIEHGHLTLSFRDILAFSSISYLSLLATALAVILWLRREHLPLLRVADAWAPCAILLWTALSLANAASGIEPGLPTDLPWGIHTASFPSGVPVHPIAFYSAIASFTILCVLIALLRAPHPTGRVAAVGLISSGVVFFLLDMLRLPDPSSPRALLDPTQWIALGGIVAGTCLLLFAPREPHTESADAL
jgi:phosphatidylglycerol---prolipoprotein diacylglyceryl transferase